MLLKSEFVVFAYITLEFEGSTATTVAICPVIPSLICLQLCPPSVLLAMPNDVAAYKMTGFEGSAAIELAGGVPARPRFTEVQVWPPSVLLKMPLAHVVYTVFGLTGSIAIDVYEFPEIAMPELLATQCCPPSVVL